MCQDKDHGGKRCDTDNSDARRHRRKISLILETARRELPKAKKIKPADIDYTELKTRAVKLGEDLEAAPPEGITQDEWDAQLEEEVTAFGMVLGAYADTLAGYDLKKIDKKIDKQCDKLYSHIKDQGDEEAELLETIDEDWDKFVEEHKATFDPDGSLSPWQLLVVPKEVNEEILANLKEPVSDEYLNIIRRRQEIMQMSEETQNLYKAADELYDKFRDNIYGEANIKLAEAYRTILKEIRPIGGDLDIPNHNASHSAWEAFKVIKETVGEDYPESWIETHNNNSENLSYAVTRDRANYRTYKLDLEGKEVGLLAQTIDSGNKEMIDRLETTYRNKEYELTRISSKHWLTNSTVHSLQLRYENDSEILYNKAEHGEMVGKRPQGEGWEYRASAKAWESLTDSQRKKITTEEGYEKVLSKKMWVKKNEVDTSNYSNHAVLSLDVSVASSRSIGSSHPASVDMKKATAYHEFGHRMEELKPVIARQEKQFLLRRTGKTSKNQFENMISSGMAFEYAHNANMVDPYMSRDYFTGENYEVLTTGLESMYAGAYGGLVGASRHARKADYEHRGFVLGILAALK